MLRLTLGTTSDITQSLHGRAALPFIAIDWENKKEGGRGGEKSRGDRGEDGCGGWGTGDEAGGEGRRGHQDVTIVTRAGKV